ncbi:glycoside hydrolase family 5 protein [Flavobacterium sp. JLP]|uniref:glycoside hydrolase family 5 protein n=1 Tax=unclassified Flavobacterium TaxID=196869 RepID=UPI00188D1A10|nr:MULTISPECIES: glycoside hydrolase family 5 protein [unclassified Flavobacterium]MBF4493481.1 glycoside hydrolase family 5 protein [Flavobacterium sp. MR2016-29]MBF4507994.1 glycoside hydrolase family 5 protein [Flavobacterium sp. JLP]
MKSKALFFTLILLLVFAYSKAQFVKHHGQLSVKGTQLTDQNNEPIVLRGMSFGWHSMWPRFYNEKAVDWLKKDFNCNVVRAAMGIELGTMSYKKEPKFSKEKIEAVIDGAIKSDIYVIIDWHSHNINLKEAKEFFAEMSKKYAKHPNIIYEVFNEPDQESWQEVKAYSEEIIKVIRDNDPNNVILVGCPHWDQDINLPAADPIMGYSNIMYTMHFYAATHGKELRDRTDAAIKSGLPVFISESAGMEASGDGPLNSKAWQEYIDWMEARKLSWITWSVSDKDETCSILKKSAKSEGKWKDEDLKEAGLKVREYLRRYNTQK